MNNTLYTLFFAQNFWLVDLLAAVLVIFVAKSFWQANPDGEIARVLRHRDRIWFALLLLFVSMILPRYLLVHVFLRQVPQGSISLYQIMNMILAIGNGAVYGVAGCWFASPARKEGRFNFGLALMVAVALFVLNLGFSMALRAFRLSPAMYVPFILAVIVVLAFVVSRLFVGKRPELQAESVKTSLSAKTEGNPGMTIFWLVVGLVPIPILLVMAASNPPNRSLAPVVLAICAICSLSGGIGCLGRIKNVAVRAVLGTCLGIFFLLLSWLVALLQACSHMNI